ncbi:hypothetical protein D9613_010733 [Agrocybe pediades]|uniref:Uncharacterized protein n=1 Tax=Agrocybe pediades TaxID=84607 RepID=A0A8H4QLP4_9AGAR|nr:hypothetical protein D9613_010733 [Agrocybe pediades]
MSDGIPQVFVDDSDPSIVYSGKDAWVSVTNISTTPQPYILPTLPPLYGTIHQINGSGSLTYIFNGTSPSPPLFGFDNVTFVSSCIIDGKRLGGNLKGEQSTQACLSQEVSGDPAPSIPFYPGDPRFNFGPSLGTGPNVMGNISMYPSSYYGHPTGLVQPPFSFQHGSPSPVHPHHGHSGFLYPSVGATAPMPMAHHIAPQMVHHPLNGTNMHPPSGQGPQLSTPLPPQTSTPVAEPIRNQKSKATTPVESDGMSSYLFFSHNGANYSKQRTLLLPGHRATCSGRLKKAHRRRNSRTVELRNCLGVIVCAECERVYRPRTDAASRKRQLQQACTGKSSARSQPCGASLVHVECDAQAHHYKVERDGVVLLVWEHFGFHKHPQPPNGRLTAEEEEALDHQVSQRPSASAHEYRTGDSFTRSIPLGEIAPALSNPRKARYEVEKSRTRLGLDGGRINNGLTSFLGSVMNLQEGLSKPFIIDSKFHGPTYLVFQTPFMRRILEESVDSWKDDSNGPRHGLVTDGDHTYFKEGVLNVTCAFSSVLCAWVPVLYTWIYKLDISHHRPHFQHISQSIVQYTKSKNLPLEPKYLLHVTDFSAAQRAAHADEYADAIISTKPDFASLTPQSQAIERAAYLKEAESAERGCDFHFWQSAERLTSNASLIAVADVPDFNRQLRIMTSRSTSLEDFNAAVKRIKDSYKRVSSWLSWWLRPAFASMIFPAVSSVDPSIAGQVPSTANAAEHSHSLLHHAAGRLPYFDGFFYTPSNATYTSEAQELDLAYNPSQAVSLNMSGDSSPYTLSSPGENFDFYFNGTSLAVYYVTFVGNNVPDNLSYTVDGGPAINFTVVNPATPNPTYNQLILQTPQYAPGQHHLNLKFLGPAGKDQTLYFNLYIVQNNPDTRKLAPSPLPPVDISIAQPTGPTPSPAVNTSTLESTSHHTTQKTIVAIAVTLSAVLALFILSVLYIKRHRSRRRHSPLVNVSCIEEDVGLRTSRGTRCHDSEDVSKVIRLVPPSHDHTRVAALPLPLPASPAPAAVAAPTATPALPAAEGATVEPLYMIHEDGGSVHETIDPQGQRQVIHLPPVYSSYFGRRPDHSEDSSVGVGEPGMT